MIGRAAIGRTTAVAASPATSGADGRRTASTKRSRRRTKSRAPTNPPPNATAPISKPSMSPPLPRSRALRNLRQRSFHRNLRRAQRLPADVQPSGGITNLRSNDAPHVVRRRAPTRRLVRRPGRPALGPDAPSSLHDVHASQRPAGAVARGPLGAGGGGEHLVPRRLVRRTGRPHGVRPSVRAHHVHGLGARPHGRVRPTAGGGGGRQQRLDHGRPHELLRRRPANALPLMLYLDSDRLGFLLPEITADKVDLQRGVVQNERRQSYENRPYGLAQENILERLFPPNHPYHWPVIGSMKDLEAATLDDVRRFFQTYYTPNNSTIAIAGDISPRDARALVQRYFGDIPRGPAVTRTPVPPLHLTTDVAAVLEDRVQLPRVYDAWHTVKAFADDDATLDVVADVLAGGRSSRLYRRLVYELQIATDVAAFQDGTRIDGKFEIFATARPGHELGELQRVIDEELRKLADQGPTAREVERARNTFEAQFLSGMERVGGFGGKADQLNFYNYFVGTPDYFQKDLDRYGRVTPAGVERAVKTYLTGAHRVVLSVVPQGKPELGVKP